MKVSILIRSIESRSNQLSFLVCKLVNQCGKIERIQLKKDLGCSIVILSFNEVEIVFAVDNKGITSGAKANLLLLQATGTWISFIDDDDDVPEYYVSEILKATDSNADCFGTNGIITTDGRDTMRWVLSKDNPNDTITIDKEKIYRRKTNHISIVKRNLAVMAGFPNISNAEDKSYSDALNPLLVTEHTIHPPMYFYHFKTTHKEYR